MRKTIKIKDLVDQGNWFFLNSSDDLVVERKMLQVFISDLLGKCGCYRGFGYLSEDNMNHSANGKTPGIRPTTLGSDDPEYHGWAFKDTDRTRIYIIYNDKAK